MATPKGSMVAVDAAEAEASSGSRTTPLLDGRLPHRQIRQILKTAYAAKTRKDLMDISKRIDYVAGRFVRIVGEFVATYAREEEKKRRRVLRPDIKGTYLRYLIFSRFQRVLGMNARTCFKIHTFIGDKIFSWHVRPKDWDPLRTFLASEVSPRHRRGHYKADDRHDDVLRAIVEDRCDILRDMIDEKRLDMRDNVVCYCGTQACAPDGVCRFSKVAVEQLIWFNQRILARREEDELRCPKVDAFVRKRFYRCATRDVGYSDDSTTWQLNRADLDMRATANGATAPSLEETRAFVYRHSFPRLVRVLHLMLYNECRAHGAPWRVVVDPRATALLNLGRDFRRHSGRLLNCERRLGDIVTSCLRTTVINIATSPSGQLRETLKARRRHGKEIPSFNWGEPLPWGMGGDPVYRDLAAERARWDALAAGANTTGAQTKKKKKKTKKNKPRHRGRHQ